MQWHLAFFYSLSVFYFVLIFLIILGLRRLKCKTSSRRPYISIIIAARNESHRIGPTLESLTQLDYPADKYEIILIDDASEDDTANIMQKLCEQNSNWKLIELHEKSTELLGKKKALSEGISQAKGELIFTTDADCIVPPLWLSIMSGYFEEDTGMVLGHSPLKTSSGLLGLILKFDNLFSAIVSAAPAKLGFPHSSVGRNLAYRKSVYEKVGGFEGLKKFRSGDDVHLTEKFRSRGQSRIDYCAHPDSFVFTKVPGSVKEIFHQQIRKNSKILKKSIPSVMVSVAVFFAYLFFLILPLIVPGTVFAWAVIMGVKLILEFIALTQAAIIFKRTSLIPVFPLMQIIYPFYVIGFSLLGVLQMYEWKK